MEQTEIKARREALGLSATKFGAYIGASHQYVSQLEHGTATASPAKLADVAEVLKRLEFVAGFVQVRGRPKKKTGSGV